MYSKSNRLFKVENDNLVEPIKMEIPTFFYIFTSTLTLLYHINYEMQVYKQ